jgi:predicted ATPase/class 3 adenylate cyclase
MTFLFTDIEGSTRLWEQEPVRMQVALAHHDAMSRAAVESHRGVVVKTTGDGIHAAFEDPLDAIGAALQLQKVVADTAATGGIALRVRCGLHAGAVQRRDDDFFGSAVNRAARIMGAAHGGQVLLSQAVAVMVGDRLPEHVALRDLGVVRLRDLASPERVYQLVHPQLRENFPALRSLEATPNNLPQQVTSFVGRAPELATVKTLLGGTRLLTLLGVGGIGKTRLSLQVAADAMDDYPDGVWFVELAPLTDPRLVPQAVASVVGVKEDAGRPVLDALVKFFKDRRLLLILDNCEHLVHACAELVTQLLQAGPWSKVIASSREHLHVAGETRYEVPALPSPSPGQAVTLAALTQYEAVGLFIDRAIAVQPAFQLTHENAQAVTEICHRLDGIPLAIELAAARVRVLSAENIATRLSDRFQVLTGGNRTALPRQQTLRALIDWSHDLLTERERILFRRLAVFAGGWTLEAAEAVCSGGEIAETEVMDRLCELVDKSLVMVVSEGGRYRLLETVRQYADEWLTQSGESDATRMRHAAFYLGFAEKVAPELLGPAQPAGLQRLDLERENLLAAHGWYLRSEGAAEQHYRLVHAIKHYWFMRGLLNLGHRVTVEALTHSGGATDSIARGKALWVAGQICNFMGRYEEAQGYLGASLAIARALDDRDVMVVVLNNLSFAALGQGDRTNARLHCEEAYALAQKMGDKRRIVTASNSLAQLHRLEGDLESAERLYRECERLAREIGNREFTTVALLNLAMVAIANGSARRAAALLLEVLDISDETGSRPAVQSVLEVSVGLAKLHGEAERAARYYGAAEVQTGITGIHRDPADDAFLRPVIAQTRAALGALRFDAEEASGRAIPFQRVVDDVRAWLATV